MFETFWIVEEYSFLEKKYYRFESFIWGAWVPGAFNNSVFVALNLQDYSDATQYETHYLVKNRS